MTKQMIEVDIPEGYEFVKIDLFGNVDVLVDVNYLIPKIYFKKKPPERIVFEKSIEKRRAKYGEYIIGLDGEIILWSLRGISKDKYYILTKIEE